MSDIEERPPDKRKRGPGQEAASLEKIGKVNGGNNATNDAALSPLKTLKTMPPPGPRWRSHVPKVYPKLFPDGELVEGGSKMRLGSIEIDLKCNPGQWRDTVSGKCGDRLLDLALATGRDGKALSAQGSEMLGESVAAEEAAMFAALPVALPDREEFEWWLADHAAEVFPALLPQGHLIEDGLVWHAEPLKIQLKGMKRGWSHNSELPRGAAQIGNPLKTLNWATAQIWPWSFARVAHLVADIKKRGDAPATVDAPPKPNGHDRTHVSPKAVPQTAKPPVDPIGHQRGNGDAAVADVGNTGENLPFKAVEITGGSLSRSIDQAEAVLMKGDNNIFQRGDFVVRVAPSQVSIADGREISALRIVPVKTAHMIERFTRFVPFRKYDSRSKSWIAVDCPQGLAAAFLERIGEWNLRVLNGIANAPTLRSDGSILDEPGYDPQTGILFDPLDVVFPPIPRQPTQAEAHTALADLKALIGEFPFAPDDPADTRLDAPSASRSVALSGILTTTIRRSIPHAPLHAFTAPAMGTGKSKLVDLAAMVAIGHEAPVLAQGKTEEEMEKRLGAALLAGDTLVSFDNCEQPLGGELLCQALTQPRLKIRILGKSENAFVLPINAAFFATGNNLEIVGDMTRRALVASLDARVERPETRTFKNPDPIQVVRDHRAKYVVAALTILRAYHVAGRPKMPNTPLGSFEVWSRWVRDALIWLGEPDPCKTMERIRIEDPRLQELAAVLGYWKIAIGERPVTVKELIDTVTDRYVPSCRGVDLNESDFMHPNFREALLVVAGDGGYINSRRLGNWLGKNKGKVAGHLRLVPATMQRGENRWKVEPA
jgi:hypothetical protein